MNKGDIVRVAVHGERGGSLATVLRATDGGQSMVIEFATPTPPPFAIRHSGPRIIMYLYRETLNGQPWGPWIEIFGGGHYEVEQEVEHGTHPHG